MNVYTAVIGDWSDDGHGKTETILVETNMSPNVIKRAYEKTAKKTKLRLQGESYSKGLEDCVGLFRDYEDNKMAAEQADALVAAGVNLHVVLGIPKKEKVFTDEEYSRREDGLWFDSEQVLRLYLEMAKVNLPDLKYKFVKHKELVKGLGYGVFHG
jgi:hypothetical protein